MKIYFTSGDEVEDHKEPNKGFEIAVHYILPDNTGKRNASVYIYIYIYIRCFTPDSNVAQVKLHLLIN